MSMPAELKAPRAEKRFFTIVKVDLDARFLQPSGAESRGRVMEMSTAGILVKSPANPKRGEKIIVYIAELGRFEGIVDRSELDCFSIALKLPELKHRKLAEQLVWLSNREELDLPESRKHRRIVPLMQRTMVTLPDGAERLAKINDISLTSVSVEIVGKIAVGATVIVGKRSATVTRVFDGGIVADFADPFAEGELDEFVRL